MANVIDTPSVLNLFTGKGRIKAETALANIAASVEQQFWIPNASRSARAVMTKANVAVKLGRTINAWLKTEDEAERHANGVISTKMMELRAQGLTNESPEIAALVEQYGNSYDTRKPLWNLMMALTYGCNLGDADAKACRAVMDGLTVVAQLGIRGNVERGLDAVATLAPVFEAMAILDATRPPPVFTALGVSPTLTATILGMDMNLKTLRLCPLKTVRVETYNEETKRIEYAFEAVLDWPEGTIHRASQYAARRSCCHACGHKISNSFNWVPFIVDTMDKVPQSLWVGRDCAYSLCKVDMKGNLSIKERLGLDA